MKIKGGFCPFCYGNEGKTPPEIQAYRPNQNGGPAPQRDTPGWTVRVVPNKFPALGIEGTLNRQADGMFDRMNGVGAHEVIVETPDHAASLATLPPKRIEDVLWTFRDRILDLKKDRRFKYILLFKNHGEAAGASLEHSHSQLIALPILPINVTQELEGVFSVQRTLRILRHHPAGNGQRRPCSGGKRRLPDSGALCSALSLRDLDSAQAA
jgi:UDPglucose--hexose-1-phosphate uridylyltransferase